MKKVAVRQMTKSEDRSGLIKMVVLQLVSVTVLVAIQLL